MYDFHVRVVYGGKVLRTFSSVLLKAMVLINLLQGREFARMRRDDRVLEVALFL